MTDQAQSGEPEGASPTRGDEPPAYRVSHLMDDLADAFSERGMVQTVAPFTQGGLKPRVKNRVAFTLADTEREQVRDVETVLETDGYAWTTGEPREYLVLGRRVADLRELRKGDRIHLNKRRGPFVVYRVMDHAPEVLQRSDPAITVELANADTDTDWMVVHWQNESSPIAYCRTKDKHAKGGFRYRKVEPVDRLGRVGPRRMYAPRSDAADSEDDSEGEDGDLPSALLSVLDDADASGALGEVHPTDLARVRALFAKPAADVFSPEDANTVHAVLDAAADGFERDADALTIETDADRDHAADQQARAARARTLADAFGLIHMDALAHRDDRKLFACPDCGMAFANRYKFPTHRRMCDAGADENSEGASDE